MHIYVAGLSPEFTSKHLLEEFANFGKVTSAEIAKEHGNGAPRGFGIVEMPIEREAVAAITTLKGATRRGSTLEVNEIKRPGPRRPGHHLQSRSTIGRNRKKTQPKTTTPT